MPPNLLSKAFNSYKLSIYQRRFEKLKKKLDTKMYIINGKYFSARFPWKDMREKYFDDLEKLINQVSKLGDMGRTLENDIRTFLQEKRKENIKNPLFSRIETRGGLNYPTEMPHVDKQKKDYWPGDKF